MSRGMELHDIPPRNQEHGETDPIALHELFNRFDSDGDNVLTRGELRELLRSADCNVDQRVADRLIAVADKNSDNRLNFNEFQYLVRSGALPKGVIARAVRSYAQIIVPPRVPLHDAVDGEYEEAYSCCPPPIALLILAIIEVGVFAYDVSVTGSTYSVSGPVAQVTIYDPHKRHEAWRFLSYTLVHVGEMHLITNLFILLLLGIPLEMVHRWWRVLVVFFSGVVAGSLATSVSDPNVYLAGASGGVYAILTAHLATIIMNWSEMAYPLIQFLIFLAIMIADVGNAIYQRYIANVDTQIGYVAHLGGAVSGLLVGIYVLKNINKQSWERYLWWAALATYVLMMAVFIVWNVAFPDYFPNPQYSI